MTNECPKNREEVIEYLANQCSKYPGVNANSVRDYGTLVNLVRSKIQKSIEKFTQVSVKKDLEKLSDDVLWRFYNFATDKKD